MEKNIDKIIETYGNMSTIEPKPGFEQGVRSRIRERLENQPVQGSFILKPALLLVFLILNMTTILTVFSNGSSAAESEDVTFQSVAEDYNVLSSDNYNYYYEGIN